MCSPGTLASLFTVVLEDFCTLEADAPKPPGLTQCPRWFGRERYVIHVFSGRRRAGDFQGFLDRMAADLADFQIFVISLDIVIDSVWGNICDLHTRNFWKSAIRQRCVVGLLGGPPCETSSRARGRHITGCRMGPRILRTRQLSWGKSSLRLKELHQLSVGNELMGFVLESIVELYCTGGIAAMEHPAPPKEPEAASIWKTPLLQLLIQLPGIELLQFAQGLWGAKSPKPTSLLVLNIPSWHAESSAPVAGHI